MYLGASSESRYNITSKSRVDAAKKTAAVEPATDSMGMPAVSEKGDRYIQSLVREKREAYHSLTLCMMSPARFSVADPWILLRSV